MSQKGEKMKRIIFITLIILMISPLVCKSTKEERIESINIIAKYIENVNRFQSIRHLRWGYPVCYKNYHIMRCKYRIKNVSSRYDVCDNLFLINLDTKKVEDQISWKNFVQFQEKSRTGVWRIKRNAIFGKLQQCCKHRW